MSGWYQESHASNGAVHRRMPTTENPTSTSSSLISRLLWTGNGRFLWLASSTASIITSKSLLSGELNYPLYLVLFQLAAVSIAQSYQARPTRQPLPSDGRGRMTGPSILVSLLYSAAICASLVVGYKTILFSSSLPAAMLVLALDWAPTDLLRPTRERTLKKRVTVLRFVGLGCGMALMYLGDYRLNATGRDMSIAFVFVVGLTQLLSDFIDDPRIISSALSIPELPLSVRNWPLCLLLPVGVAAYTIERWRPTTWIPLVPTGGVLIINAGTTAMAFHAGGFLFRPLHFASGDSSLTNHRVNRMLLMFTLLGLVSSGSWLVFPSPAILSLWQFSGFFLAFFAFATMQDVFDATSMLGISVPWLRTGYEPVELEPNDSIETLETGIPNHKTQSEIFYPDRSKPLILLIGCLSWVVFIITTLFTYPSPPDMTTNLDSSHKSAIGLDIVLAQYHRSADDIAQDLNTILQSPSLQHLTTRIKIYNKTPSPFEPPTSHQPLPNISILNIPNIGREGETYLNHIVTQWDNLATHTLFMQDDPHDLLYLQRRLADYFIPETGFMSLSYQGNTCRSCSHCHDGYWSQNATILSELYALANSGRPCQDLVLTYRGQFLVSGARIRGNQKGMYETLLRDLRDEDSWMHSPDFTQSVWNSGEVDSLDQPVFGYTLERMWGTLMQCSGKRVGDWSPGLLASYLRSVWLGGRFKVEDVQCLDRGVELVRGRGGRGEEG